MFKYFGQMILPSTTFNSSNWPFNWAPSISVRTNGFILTSGVGNIKYEYQVGDNSLHDHHLSVLVTNWPVTETLFVSATLKACFTVGLMTIESTPVSRQHTSDVMQITRRPPSAQPPPPTTSLCTIHGTTCYIVLPTPDLLASSYHHYANFAQVASKYTKWKFLTEKGCFSSRNFFN